jgi:hypothetical protein
MSDMHETTIRWQTQDQWGWVTKRGKDREDSRAAAWAALADKELVWAAEVEPPARMEEDA